MTATAIDPALMLLGRHIATARNARHWTQWQLAEAAGVSNRTVLNCETGRSVKLGNVGVILGVLGLTLTVSDKGPGCVHEYETRCRICGEERV